MTRSARVGLLLAACAAATATSASSASNAASRVAAQAGSAAKAREALNKMMLEAVQQRDIVEQQCRDFHAAAVFQYEESSGQLHQFSAEATQAFAMLSDARSTQEYAREKLAVLDEQLRDLREKCHQDASTFARRAKLLHEDLRVAKNIVSLSSCGAKQALVQQGADYATDSAGLCAHADGTTRYQHPEAEALRGKLMSDVARKAVSSLLKHSTEAVSLLQTTSSMSHQVHREVARRHLRLLRSTAASTDVSTRSTSTTPPARTLSGPADYEAQASRCTISSAPTCGRFLDASVGMIGEVADALYELEREGGEQERACHEQFGDVESQVEELRTLENDAGTRLAQATRAKSEADEAARMKHSQLRELERGRHEREHQCHSHIEEQETSLCGLRQMRGELAKMGGDRTVVQDCVVSEWVEHECSAQCGGGLQELVRTVITPPTNGAACPPVTIQRRCNDHPCPRDCELSEWDGWSKCSAECGGGVQERIRYVRQADGHGGLPCEDTSASRSCNGQACEAPCELGIWQPWSGCSRACGGGFQRSERPVVREARGNADCPAAGAPGVRLRYHRCNEAACPASFKCASQLDLVFAIDSSGSVSPADFDHVKKLTGKLVDSLNVSEHGVHAGAVVFSGPTSWDDLEKCEKTGDPKWCGVHVVSPLGGDSATLTGLVGQLKHLNGSTNMATAFSTAASLLHEGRPDVQSVIVVITDGDVSFKYRTGEAAKLAKEHARVVVVPIGSFVDLKGLAHLASDPVHDNVLGVHDWDKLDARAQSLIGDLCPKVEAVAPKM